MYLILTTTYKLTESNASDEQASDELRLVVDTSRKKNKQIFHNIEHLAKSENDINRQWSRNCKQAQILKFQESRASGVCYEDEVGKCLPDITINKFLEMYFEA